MGSNRVARRKRFGKGAMQRHDIGRDAGELLESRRGLMHAHAGAVKNARAFAGGGLEQRGLGRRVDDVGNPMLGPSAPTGTGFPGKPVIPVCVALTNPSAPAISRARSPARRQRAAP
jgi:hypothetical protein